MSPLGVVFAVVLSFTVVYCHPVAEPVPDPEAEPWVGAVATGAKLVGTALAGTVVADAFHAAGGDKVVNAATDWVSGAANTVKDWAGNAANSVKDWAGGAWESTKNFFG